MPLAHIVGPRPGITQLAFNHSPCLPSLPAVKGAEASTSRAVDPSLHQFSSLLLAAGARADPRILVWDMRRLDEPLVVIYRRVENHQRFQFSFDATGRYLLTCNQSGAISVFDMATCSGNLEEPVSSPIPVSVWRAHIDCVHGLSLNPWLPLLATSSGQRRSTRHSQLLLNARGDQVSDQPCKSQNLLLKTTSIITKNGRIKNYRSVGDDKRKEP
ncbi:unnamed protein product [Protopolystoma xenopodis]|uniref:Uncharacterized protein n=1 Tax=Protopolystoma xenopodis TaxID=117903 RepID=A0A448WUP4_9PLAT|nr:unnamed protein product [Protopolystoma xenopodis]